MEASVVDAPLTLSVFVCPDGHRTLAQIHEHMGRDDLVGWAWHPGGGRTPAQGTQTQLDALLAEWIGTGAACPAK